MVTALWLCVMIIPYTFHFLMTILFLLIALIREDIPLIVVCCLYESLANMTLPSYYYCNAGCQ